MGTQQRCRRASRGPGTSSVPRPRAEGTTHAEVLKQGCSGQRRDPAHPTRRCALCIGKWALDNMLRYFHRTRAHCIRCPWHPPQDGECFLSLLPQCRHLCWPRGQARRSPRGSSGSCHFHSRMSRCAPKPGPRPLRQGPTALRGAEGCPPIKH